MNSHDPLIMETTEVSIRNEAEDSVELDGFFKDQVLPKLQKNNYNELLEWLKQRELIRRNMSCRNPTCDSAEMTWTPARIVDKYQWICKCGNKLPIRENSFFKFAKCSFSDTMNAINGWCTGADCDQLAADLHIKNYVVKKIYEYCNSAASQHIQKLLAEEKVGGFNNVVILDVLYLDSKTHNVPIACLADIKEKPAKLIFHPIMHKQIQNPELNNNAVGLKSTKNNPKKQKLNDDVNVKIDIDTETAESLGVHNNNNIVEDENSQTSTICSDSGVNHTPTRHFIPTKVLLVNELFLLVERKLLIGTDLVLGSNVPPDAIKKLLDELQDMSSIITVDELKKRDSETTSVMKNIDEIFKFPRDLVSCTRGINRPRLPDFFNSYTWMEKYGSTTETFETLLRHIVEAKFE